MRTHSLWKWALLAVVVLFHSTIHAQTYYLDSHQDASRTHYRTTSEACVTGELESRIQGYRATETNPNVQYRISAFSIAGDDGFGEFECRGDIERTYASVWVTLELVDTFVYGPFGSAQNCNISGYGDPETGQCGSPKCTVGGAACCDVCSNGSNPINTASGNKYEKETDYVGTGPFPIRFERSYSYNTTAANTPMPLGIGWLHSYSGHVVAYASQPGSILDRVRVYRPDGRMLTFSLNGSSWQADADVTERLAVSGTGWQLTTADDAVETYDDEGRLLSITARGGYTQTLSYVDPSNHPANQVQKVTDPQGRSLSFAYDTSGRLSTLTDGNGAVITYTYDANNNLATVVYPATSGTVTRTYSYNESGQTSGGSLPNALTGIVDEDTNRYASWGYTSDGRANLSVHGAFTGGTIDRTSLAFNSNGTTTITDALGQARTFGFSVSFGVARQASLDNLCNYCGVLSKTQTYDTNGFPASATDFNSHTTNFTYDARGLEDQRVEAVGLAEQRTIATTWNSSFHVPVLNTVANASGTVITKTIWVDNTRGQPLVRCEIDPVQAPSYTCAATGTPPVGVRRWTYTYCDTVNTTQCPIVGLLLSATSPRTDLTSTTQYSYYLASDTSGCGTVGGSCHQAGDLYQVTDALGHVTTNVTYDKNGRLVRQSDNNGVITDFTYHPRGWLLSRTVHANANGSASANDAVTQIAYDAVGNVTRIVDPDGVYTSYAYDIAHRLTDVTDTLGNHVHYMLDALGNRTKEQAFDTGNTVHRTLSRSFNTLNQLTQITDGLNQAVFTANYSDSYDGNGNLAHSVDALSVQRKQSYDGLNRLISTLDNYNGTDANTKNTTTGFTYDSLDRLTQVTDPSNLNTTYSFDGLSNATGQVSPDTGTTSRIFDAAGNVLTRTDARNITATNTYDALDRLVSTSYPDTTQNVAYHYDEANSVTGCTTSYPTGRLTRIVENTVTTVYCYDNRGNAIQKKQTIGTQTDTTTYALTLADRLASITYPSGTFVSYSRDADGRIQSISVTPPNGTASTAVSSITYQPFGPVSGYTLGNGQAIVRSYDANYRLTDLTSPAFNLHVARDAMGDITAIGNATGANPATETYSYDPLYRLTAVTEANGTTLESVTYNPTGDRLSKAGSGLATGTYTYNPNTHQLTATGNAARSVDANGNTTAISQAGSTYGFGYSNRNRMTVAQLGGSTVGSYTYNALEQRVKKVAGSATERYDFNESSQLLGEYGATTREYVYFDDIPVANVDTQGTTTSVAYVTADQLGTPRAITDGGGNSVWTWAYQGNAWGEQQPSGNGYTYNPRFPGQYFDEETGLLHNGFRDYDPPSGRYTQSDPMGQQAGINTYAYVDSSPLNGIDPFGLSKTDQWYGYNNRDFQWWYHNCYKQSGDPDVGSRGEMAEVYAEYIAAGSPPRGKCWNKPNKPNCKEAQQPDPKPAPPAPNSKSVAEDALLLGILGAIGWMLNPAN